MCETATTSDRHTQQRYEEQQTDRRSDKVVARFHLHQYTLGLGGTTSTSPVSVYRCTGR